jgi:hypothetical protein
MFGAKLLKRIAESLMSGSPMPIHPTHQWIDADPGADGPSTTPFTSAEMEAMMAFPHRTCPEDRVNIKEIVQSKEPPKVATGE